MRFLVVLALVGCSKPADPAPAPPPPASVAVQAPAASAAPPPAVAPVADADGGIACGKKPLPDCPLQAWMKEHANPPVMANDAPRLAAALDEMVAFAPPGYTNWVSIAKDGAAAARSGDVAAAKASCRSCHDQYKGPYRTEMRARKI